MPPSDLSPAPVRNYTKSLVALGLIVTLGFSAVFGFVQWESRDQARERARLAAYNIVAAMASEIDRNLELYDLSLQAVVEGLKLPSLGKLSPEIRQLVLFDRAATAKDMGSIFVLDKRGTVIIDSRTLTPRPDNYSQYDFFKSQERRRGAGPYVSRPWIAPDGEYVIAISRRLSDANGNFNGVVAGTLHLSYFRKMFAKVNMGEGDALTLMRDDGTLIMRSPFQPELVGRSLANASVFQRGATFPSGSFESVAGIDGVKRFYVFKTVGDRPLKLSYGTAVAAIYAPWAEKAWRIGLLMLVLCAINLALIVLLIRALKRRSEAEYQLSIVATTDGLTSLVNRRRLDEMLHIEWSRALNCGHPMAFLMIDADGFKNYNDQFGHQAGDAALLAISQCIATTTQGSGGVSARYGGEEFVVMLPGAATAEAAKLAENIRASIAALRADQQGRPDSTPTVSIGVASLVPRQGLLPRDLVKAADAALYEAKRKGRDRVETAPRLGMAAEQRAVA
ncbi:MAG TPA: sensor domain-containing diguanylate cyclase [Xanthobacteraceae bacterium]|nr:sensor domain-containing diguanylate cyclase [Xanthobacteraceae bacterium]